MSPEASDFAWIFVVKPPRERPSAWPSCPPLPRRPTHARARSSSRTSGSDARTNSSRRARRRRLRRRRPCSADRSASTRCPATEALRQGAPPNVLDREEMERFEEPPVILGLPSTSGKTGAKHRKRMRPILIVHLRRHPPQPPFRSETYESCLIQPRNPKISSSENSSTRPSHFTSVYAHLLAFTRLYCKGRATLHCKPAIDDEGLARGEGALVGGEVDSDRGDLLRLP
jgi:hypothetical protein